MVFLDTETYLIEPGRAAPRVVCIQVQHDAAPPAIYRARDSNTESILAKLLTSDDGIVGHNIAYDFACIAATWPKLIPLIWSKYDRDLVCDTMIAQQVLDIGYSGGFVGRYSLAALSERFLGIKLDKGGDTYRLRYSELDDVPLGEWPQAALDYALGDVTTTAAIWHEVSKHGIGHTTGHQVRVAFALHLATVWGMSTDVDAVNALDSALSDRVECLAPLLRFEGILHGDSVKLSRVRELLAEDAAATGAKLKLTPTGAICTDADALRAGKSKPLLALAEYRETTKVLSTYMPILRAGTSSRIHPRYKVCVESGRTSSMDPNIQNLPRTGGVRECFVASPGFSYVAADYSMAELVGLAQVTSMLVPPSRMAEELRAGRELHIVTAASILGIEYEEAMERYLAGDSDVAAARQLAKGLNFGIPGGLGPARLVELLANYGITITLERSRDLRSLWLHKLYPEVKRYHNMVGAVGGEMVISHPSTSFRRAGMNFCSAANFYFQHICAYGAKEAVYAVQRACFFPGPLYGCRLVAFIHDELIVEVPHGCEHEAAQELQRIMVREFSKVTPEVPIAVEAHAMFRWSKKAKARYDAFGRLVPWVAG